tara:strand:- start:267 stop:1484 length:1218 start_codon:yes stop_codon:yes gene_type:complete
MSGSASPVRAQDRIASIDVLRGFALLGILVMNIQSFAMVEAAYFDPSQSGDLTGVNWWVWALSHAFADMKFMALFSMLFGAGIILATESRQSKGLSSFNHHYIRNFWLLVFGMIHAYFIWYGDILVTYALAAFALYWLRNLRALWLFTIGALVLCMPLLLNLSLVFAPPEVIQAVALDFVRSPEDITAEIAAYRGSWTEELAFRAYTTLEMQTAALPAFLIWRASGLMLIGMALFKVGVLSGRHSSRYYLILVILGLCVGLPLVTLSVINLTENSYDPVYSRLGIGLAYNYIGSIAMAMAYVGIVMRFVQSSWLSSLQRRLAAVGRTAFTNYFMQSLICTFIFYGVGLGLFNSSERWQQVLIVIGIWTLQLVLAPLWLEKYRFGPLEWLWRSLTYMSIQPMRREL